MAVILRRGARGRQGSAFEDEGRVIRVEGNYADYDADRRKRLGAEAERPHRLRFKKLPRG